MDEGGGEEERFAPVNLQNFHKLVEEKRKTGGQDDEHKEASVYLNALASLLAITTFFFVLLP